MRGGESVEDMERMGTGNGDEKERRQKKKQKDKERERRKMGISPAVLSSSHVTSDSNPQKTKCFIARMGIFCYAL